MASTIQNTVPDTKWNVLTSPWLEVMTLDAEPKVLSPLDALDQANSIKCIPAPSPLDLFATHRFLLTLLYWKADVAGGVHQVRQILLEGKFPPAILKALEREANQFNLFDQKAPFLQDPAVWNEKGKSAGSLFAEFACGTNIAHFHHGDDEKMRLCVKCASIGILRIVPWSQSGGAGISPSVHNAPPVVAIADGGTLAHTLALNFIPLEPAPGEAQWTGHFVPAANGGAIRYLEAFTWNPRRAHLGKPEPRKVCWRCGKDNADVVGPIVYSKNERTKQEKIEKKTVPFVWMDPSAFYAAEMPYSTMKSREEAMAVDGSDLAWFFDKKKSPASLVGKANQTHKGWHLIIPCTNPANNKTFDHRQIELDNLSPDGVRNKVPIPIADVLPDGLVGWADTQSVKPVKGCVRFLLAATKHLTYGDWGQLSVAAFKPMHEAPAAFHLFAGLFWGLRNKKIHGLPQRNVAWLILKLMAFVSAESRKISPLAQFNPLRELPKQQIEPFHKGGSSAFKYPVSFPRGRSLESGLRGVLSSNMNKRFPVVIDWPGLCDGLDQLIN